MINFLKTLPLFRDVYRQGGIDSFPLAQKDILETMRDDLDAKAEELANEKLRALLTIVDVKMVVTLDKNTRKVFIGGIEAPQGRLTNLKSEAEFLEQSDIWKIINASVRELAQKAMFISGESLDDMKKCRSILYTLDSQNKMIDIFKAFIHRKE